MVYSNDIFYSANDFFRSVFSRKVYKISIDAGCTCPNRDGSKGWGGCIYCSSSGSGDFSQNKDLSVSEQIENAKKLVSGKISSPAYLAYFQNYTNTYGDINVLYEKFKEASVCPDVVGVVIATRPDCMSDEVVSAIKKLSESTFVMIEFGFQTSREKSVWYINRCYENKELDDAVKRLKISCPDIHVVCHVIFGLPSETAEDMLSSVRYVLNAGADGIKISLLHVLKDTALAVDYEKGLFRCMEKDEYFRILGYVLEHIPEDIVIHRVTGDGSKRVLIAPLWTGDKKKVLNSMMKYFRDNSIQQGRLCSNKMY